MQSSTTQVSPFDWRLVPAREAEGSGKAVLKSARPGRPLSARERAERILAHRWGNPYCKPGAP